MINISFGKKKKYMNKKKTQNAPMDVIEEEEKEEEMDQSSEEDIRLKLGNKGFNQKGNPDEKIFLSLPNSDHNRPRTLKKPNTMMIEVKNQSKDSEEITLTKESIAIPATLNIDDDNHDSDDSLDNSDMEEITTTENNVKTTF